MKRSNNITTIPGKLKTLGAALLTATLMLSSCGKKEMVPEDDLYAILKEIHFTTGILSFTDIRDKYSAKDSIAIYTGIYDKYGYSREEVESTLNYYFVKKNKKLKKFYNDYIGELTKLEASLVEERLKEVETTSRVAMDERTMYRFPAKIGNGTVVKNIGDSTAMDSPMGTDESQESQMDLRGYFERQLLAPGTYTLTFTVTVDPSDKTVTPYMSLYIKPFGNREEPIEPQKVTTIKYLKDGNDYNFVVPITKTERAVMVLYGNLFDTPGDASIMAKNAYIRNIKLDYVP